MCDDNTVFHGEEEMALTAEAFRTACGRCSGKGRSVDRIGVTGKPVRLGCDTAGWSTEDTDIGPYRRP